MNPLLFNHDSLGWYPQKPDAILIQQILANIPKIGAIRAA
jgi:hypothetical protein